jgi:DNA ligase-1
MLGKTFKGMTDAMLAWQTERLRALAVSEEGPVVHVRPELVETVRGLYSRQGGAPGS